MIQIPGMALAGPAPPSTGPPQQSDAPAGDDFAAAISVAMAAGGLADPAQRAGPEALNTGVGFGLSLPFLAGELPGGTAVVDVPIEAAGSEWPFPMTRPDRAAGAGVDVATNVSMAAMTMAALPGGAGAPTGVAVSFADAVTDPAAGAKPLPQAANGMGGSGSPGGIGPLVGSAVSAAVQAAQLAGASVSEAAQAALETVRPSGVPDGAPATEPVAHGLAVSGDAGEAGDGAAFAPGLLRAAAVTTDKGASPVAARAGEPLIEVGVEHGAPSGQAQAGFGSEGETPLPGGSTGGDGSPGRAGADAALAGSEVSGPSPAGIESAGRAVSGTAAAVASSDVVDATDGPQLARALADSVHAASLRGSSQVRLRLDPPELGRLDIRIADGADGVRVVVEAATREAQELLRQHLPALRLGLEARELRVERLDVELARDAEESSTGADGRAGADGRGEAFGQRDGNTGADGEPLWSPVAALNGDGPATQAGIEASNRDAGTNAGTNGGQATGRLDLRV